MDIIEENPNKAVYNRNPDGTFGSNNLANPAGRPKGVSLKEYAKRKLEWMTDEQKETFLKGVAKDFIWKMAEGMPSSEFKHTGDFKNTNIEITDQIISNTESEIISRLKIQHDEGGDSPIEEPTDIPVPEQNNE